LSRHLVTDYSDIQVSLSVTVLNIVLLSIWSNVFVFMLSTLKGN
jgi:hypothetical protein